MPRSTSTRPSDRISGCRRRAASSTASFGARNDRTPRRSSRMDAHREAILGRSGARRREHRVSPGRGPRACRPERGRQVDPDQDPDRRLSRRCRQDAPERERRSRSPRPETAQRGGISTIYQEINLIPYRSVAENIFLGRAPRRFGLIDWAQHEPGGRRAAAPLRRQDRCRPAALRLQHRHPADGRHRPRGLVRRQAGDHGRADLLARRSRGRGPLRRDPAAARRRRLGDLRQPQARRALCRLRPRHGDARRPHRRDEPDGRRSASSSSSPPCSGATCRPCAASGQTGFHGGGHAADRTLLEAEGLRSGIKVKDVACAVRAGEIVGLAGLLGSGRTELARAIFGADRADAGTIRVDGKIGRPSASRSTRSRMGSASAPRTARSKASFPKCRCART